MTAVVEIVARRETHALDVPLRFGPLVIDRRSYCLVEARLEDGRVGTARSIDREIDVAEIVRSRVAPTYTSAGTSDPGELWHAALHAAAPALSSGAGLRALSLVDLAVRDAVGPPEPHGAAPDVWAVIGYPPEASPDAVVAEASAAVAAGAAGVKLPIGMSDAATRARVAAVTDAVGPARTALDLAWRFDRPDDAARLVAGLELAWVEDPFPPGRRRELGALRRLLDVPLAAGDEVAHLDHPEALLDAEAVDILRVDAACQGGATRFLALDAALASAGAVLSWHMSPDVHAPLARAMSATTRSVETSAPGSGVDPLEESSPLAEAISRIRRA